MCNLWVYSYFTVISFFAQCISHLYSVYGFNYLWLMINLVCCLLKLTYFSDDMGDLEKDKNQQELNMNKMCYLLLLYLLYKIIRVGVMNDGVFLLKTNASYVNRIL